ncbi:MAG: hypothetical protein IKB12_07690 [Clostridia bacterium]|nr:hypothetical protein [Clostridia bacterium]
MKNKKAKVEKVEVEKVEQKQCKGYHCTTMLPYGDKHILCEQCRGKCADGVKKGTKVVLSVASIVVTVATAGRINPKKG